MGRRFTGGDYAIFQILRRVQNVSMCLVLELKLFISFAVFAVILYNLLLTVLVFSEIDDGFQVRVSRLHMFSL